MEIKFRRYQSDDFDRMHSFFINSNHKLGYIRNWTFDRMNFSPCFGQIMHDYTEHWPDEIGIWEYENGEIAAIVCSEGEENGIVFINIDRFDLPRDFYRELFEFGEENISIMDGPNKTVWVEIPENDPLEAIAKERGYSIDYSLAFNILKMENEFDVSIPEGFRITTYNETTAEQKAIAHARAFGYIDEPIYVERSKKAFEALAAAKDFYPEYGVFIVAPDGEIASFCCVWYDELNKYVSPEPVGTIPEYQKLGLGQAAVYEALNRVKRLGAQYAIMDSNKEFYKRVGFVTVTKINYWSKVL
ncbi:GNAT family N-acetyltransferase [Lutispora sp.]|uniref:GNAT family N-acetyltransferase n=1 Tax=Lutispora sp. TaxID=2828727 RepID=UPI002B1F281F|nr:GNAT family N-acetyltransferase [Lutispora sp.]MEA4962907.1 GNAT family N-acetyltransferase [Lutispora sp.]